MVQFLSLFSNTDQEVDEALNYIEAKWEPAFTVMAVEMLYLMRRESTTSRLLDILKSKTGQAFGYDMDAWYRWIWSQPEQTISTYPEFKGRLYGLIDPRFQTYFFGRRNATIRLDEVRWGGVRQDGIPPLRSPEMISAAEADYLGNDHVVFGIAVNGDVRAYPKRILAWHEMFTDTVGGQAVAGVYCTLCGTVILYHTNHEGTAHRIGTSGFLYRSNKLMYDQETQSLWSTLYGEPVLGPLVGQDIELESGAVVTTTWGEWKRRHPQTLVLSLDTGHDRNYGEGVAYQDYFGTDELMFIVPGRDMRLKNKDEILALRFPEYPEDQLAISARYLSKHPIHQDEVGSKKLVVLTDRTGGNRVYERQTVWFISYDQDTVLVDTEGITWTQYEDRLVSQDGTTLNRLPFHRSFWFAWHAQFPETRLIH